MFTDWYGEQSCTAGRAAFITAQSPIRTGLTKVGLPGGEVGRHAELNPTRMHVWMVRGEMSPMRPSSIDVDDRLDKSPVIFLRQVVANAGHDIPVLTAARELVSLD